MKQIPLTQGKFAIVDDADFEWLNQWKWYALKGGTTWYAVRNTPCKNGKQTPIRMHREILGLTRGDGIETDHKDGNGLNNQRSNLRPATTADNQHNRKTDRRKKTSQFKGVCWNRSCAKWQAQITVEGKRLHLGLFLSEIAAARAYDAAAIKYFGEFSCTNF